MTDTLVIPVSEVRKGDMLWGCEVKKAKPENGEIIMLLEDGRGYEYVFAFDPFETVTVER